MIGLLLRRRIGESPSADTLAHGTPAPVLSHPESAREEIPQLTIVYHSEHHAKSEDKQFVSVASSTEIKACARDPAVSSSALSWSLDTVGSLPQVGHR